MTIPTQAAASGTKSVKRALVTGGSGGIGAAICRLLARDGCEVIVHAHRNIAAAESLAAQIRGTAVAFDVTDAAAARDALERLLESAPIQIVVNNAGIHDDAAFPGMRREQWMRVIDVSLHGFFNVTQPLVLPMIRTRWGRIITITSVAAQLGNRGQANYAAAKGALHSATRSLAREIGSRGVTVNCVAPGIIATAMSEGAFDAAAIARLVPLQRAGTPDDVAHVVGFLASDSASYITGQVLSVNGGMT
jgi:3-oxoacyl-[acyl-carrier protein] reductase